MVIHRFPAFRQIAVQSGADIRGIRLIPPHDHLGEALGPWLPSGCGNAAVLDELMRIAHQVLDHHPFNEERRRNGKLPANGIWLWAEGYGGGTARLRKAIRPHRRSDFRCAAVPWDRGAAGPEDD